MSGRIEIESEAYRRGVVLGLTLAEVGILLVFVLLLLVGFERYRQTPEPGETRVAATDLERLRADSSRLGELARSLPGSADVPISEDFIQLLAAAASQLQQQAGGAATMARLREESAALAAARAEAQRLLTASSGAEAAAQVSARLDQQAREVARGQQQIDQLQRAVQDGSRQLQEQQQQLSLRGGQVAQLQKSLADAGRGRVYPSCWTAADGTVEYIYAVELASAGLRIQALPRSPTAARAAQQLPLPRLRAGELLSVERFLAVTRDLYMWSEANNCRFFAVVHDATAAHEKERFKTLLLTVEAHFYKRLSDAPAAF